MGRLGGRVPLYGSIEDVVGQAKVVAWIERLLSMDWGKHPRVALAMVQLARVSSDARRDVPEALRRTIIDRLNAIDTPEGLVRLVREVTVLDESEKAQLFGDTLPAGLRLTTTTE